MSNRHFPMSKWLADGQVRTAMMIKCYKCGKNDQMVASLNGRLPPEAAIQYFRKKGWLIGQRPNGDCCAECQQRKPKTRKIVEMVPKNLEQAKAEPPREMTREDRRIVYSEIEGAYNVEATRYYDGKTDETVARDLGVPRVWVQQIREEFFGPETNVEIETLRREITALRKIMDDLKRDYARVASEYSAVNKQMINAAQRMSELETLTDRINKAIGPRKPA